MKSKYTLISGLCIASVLSTTAFGAKHHAWEGIYAAITGSVLGFESEAEIDNITVSSGDDYTVSPGVENDYGENGFGGELALGYGLRGDKWALDGEVFANFIGAIIDKDFDSGEPGSDSQQVIAEETVEAEASWGVRIKPAYFLHEQVKLFIPLAILQTQFEHEYTVIDPSTGALSDQSEDEEATGFEFGFGIEAFLTPNTSLAVSATRTVYEEYDIDLHTGNASSDPGIIENEYTNSINRGNVTFIYRFGGSKHSRHNGPIDK